MLLCLLAVAVVGGGSSPRRSPPPGLAGPGEPAALRRAVAAWIARERDAYRRRDVEAFQPCPDSAAAVLRDVDGVAHRCADVQAHLRSRMGGELAIRVDSIGAGGDSGVVYNTMTFRRRVRRAGRWERREIVAVHRDLWRRVAGTWQHVEMAELVPQRVLVDGRPVRAQPRPRRPRPPNDSSKVTKPRSTATEPTAPAQRLCS